MIHKKTLLFALLSVVSGALHAQAGKQVRTLAATRFFAAICPNSQASYLQVPSPNWSQGMSPNASSPSPSCDATRPSSAALRLSPSPSNDAMALLISSMAARSGVQPTNEFFSDDGGEPMVGKVEIPSGDGNDPTFVQLRYPPGDRVNHGDLKSTVVKVEFFSGDDSGRKVVKEVEFLSDADNVASLLGDGSEPKIFVVTFASRNGDNPGICFFKYPPGD